MENPFDRRRRRRELCMGSLLVCAGSLKICCCSHRERERSVLFAVVCVSSLPPRRRMLTLSKKLRRESESSSPSSEANNNNDSLQQSSSVVATQHHHQKKVSIRDKLLVKEFQELDGGVLPPSCVLSLVEEDRLCEFDLTVRPDEGFWAGGQFAFHVVVPEDYNFSPPRVVCLTRIWHPNITEDGAVCLSLLRESSIDEMGWAPTRTLKDVVWGLNSLFTDLLNFDDPLNALASEEYRRDKEKFKSHVNEYIKLHCLKRK